jgi:hypothetical protein
LNQPTAAGGGPAAVNAPKSASPAGRPTADIGLHSLPHGAASAGAANQIAANVPLYFEKNEGQADKRAGFLARMPNATLYLTGADAMLVHLQDKGSAAALKMSWVGASSAKAPVGEAEMAARSNYFIGNDSTQWHAGIANFERVKQESLYPGVDLVYYGNQQQLEYDLTVAPGASAEGIRLRIEGAKSVSIDKATGDLILEDALGSPLRLHRPLAYQTAADGSRQSVGAVYTVAEGDIVGFRIGAYDRSRALVIDPVIQYTAIFAGLTTTFSSSYTPYTQLLGMAVDPNGKVYLEGITNTIDMPTTTGAYSAYQACGNASTPCTNYFVARFNTTKNGAASLEYATYIGNGNVQSNELNNFGVDSTGNAYLVGSVLYNQNNYPITANAYSTYCQGDPSPYAGGGCGDYVLTRLNAAGNALAYSTFVQGWSAPGAPYDYSPAKLAVGGSDGQTAYLGGGDFWNGSAVLAFDTAQSGSKSLVYATSLPMGSLTGIAADSAGNAYAVGVYEPNYATDANDQTLTWNGYLTTPPPSGYSGPMLVALNASGINTYTTFLGQSLQAGGAAYGFPVAADPGGIVYVGAGGSGVPQKNPLPPSEGVTSGAFVTKIDTALTGSDSLLYSTYLDPATAGPSDILGIASNGTGTFAVAGVVSTPTVFAGPQQPWVNPLILPQMTYPYPSGTTIFTAIIDPSKTGQQAIVFDSFLDGVATTNANPANPGVFPDLTVALDNQNNLFIGGMGAEQAAGVNFYSGASGTNSYEPGFAIPATNYNFPFFYKVALGPVDSLQVSPYSIQFPSQQEGSTSAAIPFSVTNTSQGSVTLATLQIAGEFKFSTDGCSGVTLPAGQPCQASVIFSPTATGALSGTVSVSTPTSNAPIQIGLSGNGVSTSTPTISIVPNAYNFGNVQWGTSASATFTISNTGIQPITGTYQAITPSFPYSGGLQASSFSVKHSTAANDCSQMLTIPAGGNCQATVAFTPVQGYSTTTYSTGWVDLEASYSPAPTAPVLVEIDGTGVSQAAPPPAFSPGTGNYSTTQTVTIKDAGATIYYTTDGTMPSIGTLVGSTQSCVGSCTVMVTTSTIVTAIATVSGDLPSGTTVATYTYPAATPVLSPAGGTFPAAEVVNISDTTPNATIFYSINGATAASCANPCQVNVGKTETLSAYATAVGFSQSKSTAKVKYTILQTPSVQLTPSTTTPTYGSTLTLTATVTGPTGGPTPTKTVDFYSGASMVHSGTLSGGSAMYTTGKLQVGSVSYAADYLGDSYYNSANSSTLNLTVSKATPKVTVTSSVSSVTYDGKVTLTATVTGVTGSATPSGSVTFKSGTTTLGSSVPLNSSGVATLSTALAVGADSITASYGSDANYNSATSAAIQVKVNPATPTVKTTASASSISFGTSVTLTATVTGVTGGTTPSGSVTFKSGSTTISTVPLSSSKATVSTTLLAKGTDSITASYTGDSNYTLATSPAVLVTVK